MTTGSSDEPMLPVGVALDETLPATPAAGSRAAAVLAEVGNEAVPAVPPAAPVDPMGSIPHVSGSRRWARAQASNWRLYLVRFLSAGIAVVLTVMLVPGLRFTRGWEPGEFLLVAVVFGLLNMLVKPVLQFVALRFIFNTYGLVVVLINALLLVMLTGIVDDLMTADRPIAIVAGGLVVGILGLFLETLLGATPPVLDRDYKERNGLS